jgi:hypothetical protein
MNGLLPGFIWAEANLLNVFVLREIQKDLVYDANVAELSKIFEEVDSSKKHVFFLMATF